MEKHIQKFMRFAAKELKLSKMPKINFVGHSEDNKRTFGHYKNDGDTITVRIVGRHPLDVMRTITHELIHYKQKTTNIKDQTKEDQANAMAGRIMRKYGEQNPQLFNEDAVASSMLPSNNVGSGEIASFSPLLGGGKKEKKRTMLSRIAPSSSLNDKAGDKGKSLRDIVGKNKVDKDMKKEKKFINPFGV